MDDEAPLAALAGAPAKSSYDDDTPLAALATASKPKVQTSSAKRAAPGMKGTKGKAKGKGKGSSSSSSSGSSGSGSDSDSEAGQRRPAKKLKKPADDGALQDDTMKRAKDKRTSKEKLVADVLSRWWYGNQKEWPPIDDEYYKAELRKRQLRQVDITQWEWENDMDEKGYRKCYGLQQFYGVFRDSQGNLIDLRPMESCPSFDNYIKKDQAELYRILETCLEGQLKALDKSVYDESRMKAELTAKLARTRDFKIKNENLQGKKTQLPH